MIFTPFRSTCFSLSNDGPYIMVRAHLNFVLWLFVANFQYFAFFSTIWTVFGKPKTDSCSWVHFASDGTIFGNCWDFHFRSISFCGLDFSIFAKISTHPQAPLILSMVVHGHINDRSKLSIVVHSPINDRSKLSIVVHSPINDRSILSTVVHGPIN